MEKTTTPCSGATALAPKASQLHLFLQSLVFTGILYMTAGLTLPKPSVTVANSSQSNARLLTSVSNAVLHDVSQHSGLPTSTLNIVQPQQRTWLDDCLGIKNNFGVLCTKMNIPGWEVTVESGQQRWTYHTNASGSVVKLAQGTASAEVKSKE